MPYFYWGVIAVPPVSVLIKPASGACNMACEYCFYRDETQNRENAFMGFMSLETAEMTVRRAFEFADKNCSFLFQGGEPTLVGLDFYKKFVEFERKYNTKNLKVFNSIQTNGYALDAEWARFFADNSFLVGLSLDGPAELHNLNRCDKNGGGTFNRVMNTAALFDKFGVPYNILTVLTGKNARSVNKIFNFCLKHKFGYLQFIPCLDTIGGTEKTGYSLSCDEYAGFLCDLFNAWFSELKKGRYVSVRNIDNILRIVLGMKPEICSMNGHCSVQFVTEGDGSVYPCDFYALDGYKIGNVSDMTFADMAAGEVCRDFIERSLPVPAQCKNCFCYALCRNGCMRERELNENGEYVNRFCGACKTFFSQYRDALFEAAAIVRRM